MRQCLRQVRRILNTCMGRDIIPKTDIALDTERFGSEYGGWIVAHGKLNAGSVVYSFGIGEDISFDIDMIQTFGVVVHAFDPTPKSLRWVETQNLPDNFRLHHWGLAAFDGEACFCPPENPEHVSHTMLRPGSTREDGVAAPVKRLHTTMDELGHDHVDVLKMDIEGAEYEVIDELCRSGIRPSQVLVEFHHRFPTVGVQATRRAIAQLRGIGYRLFAVSASGQEFSFIL